MRYVKPLSVALAAIGLSTSVFANSSVFVPSQHGGFKVGVDTVYVRENSMNKYVDNTFDFGTNIQIGYLFGNTGNDLTLSYTYLKDSDSDLNVGDVLIKGKQECNLDRVDLEAGQHLIGGAFDMRLFAGVLYTRLGHKLGLDVVDNKDSYSEKFTTTFLGFGPKFGADVRYGLNDGFGLDTHLNTALLVGRLNSKYDFGNLSAINPDVNRVVPAVAAKIGFDFTHTLASKDKLVLEAGYQTSNYFNAVDNSDFHSAQDVSFNGAYLDIKYTS